MLAAIAKAKMGGSFFGATSRLSAAGDALCAGL
jgi:hypothetical protein